MEYLGQKALEYPILRLEQKQMALQGLDTNLLNSTTAKIACAKREREGIVSP
jgi:hypothetical protein